MFIHPLLRLLVTEPQLLADHVEAYAVLVDEEIANVVFATPRVRRLPTTRMMMLTWLFPTPSDCSTRRLGSLAAFASDADCS